MSERILTFDDGSQKVWLDEEKTRCFKWYPNDLNFVDRLLRLQAYTETLLEKLRGIPGLEKLAFDDEGNPTNTPEGYGEGTLEALSTEFCEQFDFAFGDGVSKAVFGRTNPLSPVGGGKLVFESFLEAALPLVEESFKGFGASREKYMKGLQNRPKRRPGKR